MKNSTDAKIIFENVASSLSTTVRQLALNAGLNPTSLYDLEIGRTKKISARIFRALTQAYPIINQRYLLSGQGPVLNNLVITPAGSDMILVSRAVWEQVISCIVSNEKTQAIDFLQSNIVSAQLSTSSSREDHIAY